MKKRSLITEKQKKICGISLWAMVISYGALLLLLMPATGKGVLGTAAALTLGLFEIVVHKVYEKPFWKTKKPFFLLIAVALCASSGKRFYFRWIPSTKMQAIASLLHMPVEGMLLLGSLAIAALSVYMVYAMLQMFAKFITKVTPWSDFVKCLLSGVAASMVMVVLSQVMVDALALEMGLYRFRWGVLIVWVVILFCYSLLGKFMPAVVAGTGFFMVISTINVYVYQFRSRMFDPVDIFSAGTAMNVADNYSLFPIPLELTVGWIFFGAMLALFFRLPRRFNAKIDGKKRLALLLVCVLSAVSIRSYTARMEIYHWHNQAAEENGYILDFTARLKQMVVPKPEGYSTELVAQLAEQYGDTAMGTETSRQPHIIVIMDESFSDLHVLGEFSTNQEIAPFISSLKENTVSGYALASVYGGNTANSEYEFLTGNSMAWLSPNTVPYQQYLHEPTYSMVSYLKSSYDYRCVAMHPYLSDGWNRPNTYKNLGFDVTYFEEDFPREHYIRDYISDQEMFEFLIETYESRKDEPLFFFGVTMQNHGEYAYEGENFQKHITLEQQEGVYPEVEQYLSVIHETDKAVEYLIHYFENVDEEVVILFFGDHQPYLRDAFYQTTGEGAADPLGERQKRYMVPFFIWTNYDTEEKVIERTSLNYLSNYVYEVAGIPLPPYNRFLRQMEEVIPVINASGYYSAERGSYQSFSVAEGETRNWLETYKILQYNSSFDKGNRNDVLFPVVN